MRTLSVLTYSDLTYQLQHDIPSFTNHITWVSICSLALAKLIARIHTFLNGISLDIGPISDCDTLFG